MERLRGRVAVVSGASEGIGEAIVRRLAAHGMKVAALARRRDKLEELEVGLKAKGLKVAGYQCDVQKASDVKDAFDKIGEELGAVTILVNNAANGALVNILDIDMDVATSIINTNILGVLNCTKSALASMKGNSIKDGHIININSISGQRAPVREHGGVYSASKHALRVLTESLRSEIVKNKLKTRVTSISPGATKTKMSIDYRNQNPHLPNLIAENIADALLFAITVPSNVNISEMIIDPI